MASIKKYFSLSIITLSLAACGCEEVSKYVATTSEVNLLKEKIAKMESDLNKLSEALEKSKSDITNNAVTIWKVKYELGQFASAEFDPTDTSFQRLDTNIGSFFVSCKSVTKYLDGSKLLLHIGNPYDCDYEGLTLKCVYGKREPVVDKKEGFNAFFEANQVWKKSLSDKSVNLTNKIMGGTWNKVYINLPAVKPEELGYIKISASFDQAILRTKRN